MTKSLQGKHVIVTGGGTGVGAEIARQFAANGASVSIFGRRQAPLEDVASQTGASFFCCDVTNADEVQHAVSAARTQTGPVSIAVANAGAATSRSFAAMSSRDISSMLDVNLLGVFNLWHAAFEDMQSAGWGRMIAVASSAGLKGYSYVSGYCAAKHAVIGLTRSLALELAKTGITVNSICPGFVDTPMLTEAVDNIVDKTGMPEGKAAAALKANNPMNRFIQVDEVAATALWLAGDDARSISGQAVSINGGEL